MRGARGRWWGRPPVRNRFDDRLAHLDPLEFERVVAEYYRRQGYRVEHCGTGGGRRRFDGGIDLKMYRDGEYTIVQCKRENALQVTHNVGHELLGVLSTERADHAIVVNAGEFTRHAWATAAKNPRLQLIDGARLREMLPELAVAVEASVTAPPGEVELAPLLRRLPNCARPLPAASEPAGAVGSGRERRYGRPSRARPGRGSDAAKALAAMAALTALLLWQCSRSPVQRQLAPPVTSVSTPVLEAPPRPLADPTPGAVDPVPEYSEAELRERAARADEAIKVIEATTPEM